MILTTITNKKITIMYKYINIHLYMHKDMSD